MEPHGQSNTPQLLSTKGKNRGQRSSLQTWLRLVNNDLNTFKYLHGTLHFCHSKVLIITTFPNPLMHHSMCLPAKVIWIKAQSCVAASIGTVLKIIALVSGSSKTFGGLPCKSSPFPPEACLCTQIPSFSYLVRCSITCTGWNIAYSGDQVKTILWSCG